MLPITCHVFGPDSGRRRRRLGSRLPHMPWRCFTNLGTVETSLPLRWVYMSLMMPSMELRSMELPGQSLMESTPTYSSQSVNNFDVLACAPSCCSMLDCWTQGVLRGVVNTNPLESFIYFDVLACGPSCWNMLNWQRPKESSRCSPRSSK